MMKNNPKQEILNAVLPRIWQPKSTDESKLALEIVDGPYKGVIYGYTEFGAVGQTEDGMIPVKYETVVYSGPKGFQQDEAFDAFTRDVLVAWLELVAELEHSKGQ
jgi:hypothetical protein